jgi:peptidoglycan/xylan/chitin deacetylase (PgdA/CDA1 family)
MKKERNLLITLLFLLFWVTVNAQQNPNGVWNNHQLAVVLTYDDGLDIDLDNVKPVLDSAHFRATFFVPGHSKSLKNRMDEWRALAAEGHELGNHTLFHPCFGKSKNRKWVNPDYDLDHYSLAKIQQEIVLCNTLLHAIDNKTERTFAYTCGDTAIHNVPILKNMKNVFVAARGVQPGLNFIGKMNIYNLKVYGAHGVPGDSLIAQVKKARRQKAPLLIFLFHGVDGKHPLRITGEAHRELIRYLEQHRKEIWVAPLREVMNFYRKYLMHGQSD